MNKRLKTQIMQVFNTPIPQRKEEFLRNLNYPKIRWYHFVFSQIGYIRPKVWLTTAAIFFIILLLSALPPVGNMNLLWVVSALLPFLALVAITEIARSAMYQMAELEMTTRYHLRSVLLVRMGILGVDNLIVLLIVMPLLRGKVDISLWKLGIYLLLPYLLTCFLSFVLVNRLRSKDYAFYCAAVAVTVSCGGLLFGQIWNVIYQQKYFMIWLILLVVLVLALFNELKMLIKNTEELIWNSYLTV